MRLKKVKSFFTMMELLIVIAVMMILMFFTFQAYIGFITQGKITKTRLLVNALTVSIAKITYHVQSESRVNSITMSQHPLFAEGYKANHGRTIADKEYKYGKITANPLQDLISKADLAFEEEGFGVDEINTVDGSMNMLVDAFFNPVMIVRNEVAMALEIERLKDNKKYREDVYKDREKTYVTGYMMYELDCSPSGKNLYEWNDTKFVKEYKILDETSGKPFCDIYDKVMIPYTKNGFDIWSAGPDGMIANLIPSDYSEDRWKNKNDKEYYGWVKYGKVNSVYPNDVDNDNISEIKGAVDNDFGK